jgi:hypothetical protein
VLGRTGKVFADRYHMRILKTPTEVKNALRYVLDNRWKHNPRRPDPIVHTPHHRPDGATTARARRLLLAAPLQHETTVP